MVYPSQRGGWSAQCVTDHKTKRPKLPFPQSWAGQPQDVYKRQTHSEASWEKQLPFMFHTLMYEVEE